jgi:hypothetical protein
MNLTGHHRTTLRKIFAHPLDHNIQWHEAVALLQHVGTATEHEGALRVTLGGHSTTLHAPHSGHGDALAADQVMDLRRLLEQAGITPETQGEG